MTFRDRLEELFDEEDRLKAEIVLLKEENVRNKDLIREMSYALVSKGCFIFEYGDLIQRAREAIR
jgi:cell division protein FtsB